MVEEVQRQKQKTKFKKMKDYTRKSKKVPKAKMPSVNGKLLDIIYPDRIKPVPMPKVPSILDKQGKFKKGKKPKRHKGSESRKMAKKYFKGGVN